MKAEQLSDGDNDDDFSPDLSNYNLLVAGEIAAANGLVASALFQVTFRTSTSTYYLQGAEPADCIRGRSGPEQKNRRLKHCLHLVRNLNSLLAIRLNASHNL